MNRTRTRARVVYAATVAALVGVLTLAGCSGNDAGDASSAGAQAESGAAQGGAGAAQRRDAAPASAQLIAPKLIQRATVKVRHQDVARARSEVRTIVDRVNGVIESETSRADDDGALIRSALTLRVPADSFNDVLDTLGDLGELVSQRRSTEDVTAQVVDVDSRVASARASVQRVRELLDRADDLSEVVAIESELASREADLESLQAQQAELADRTEFSTIRLTIDRHAPAADSASDQAGFLTGLTWGWNAFVTVLGGLVTVLGALLPFLLVIVPVCALAWFVVRRTHRRRAQPAHD